MRNLVMVFLILISFHAQAANKHLDKLRSRYPFGLIGDDYGVLSQEDLAVNTCNTTNVTPYSAGENMAYPYWQCFPVSKIRAYCDPLGYDRVAKTKTGYFVIDGRNEKGLQSYLARGAKPLFECKGFLARWKRKIESQKYVCVSGSSNGSKTTFGETDWVLEKFKTASGCESFGSDCDLKDVLDKTSCVLPK